MKVKIQWGSGHRRKIIKVAQVEDPESWEQIFSAIRESGKKWHGGKVRVIKEDGTIIDY